MGEDGQMEGVEFQLRTHTSQPGTARFPHSLDKRTAQGDEFRRAKEVLQTRLQEIEQFYTSRSAGSHGGPPNCARCARKQQDIIKAYHEYYLSSNPEAWYHDFPQYREEMERRFKDIKDIRESLDSLQHVFESALREHLKEDLCTPVSTDTPELSNVKNITANMFDQGLPIAETLNAHLNGVDSSLKISSDSDTLTFLHALQNSSGAADRAQIYKAYYCTPYASDTPQQKNLKAKYARMFLSLVPHDEVVAAMNKEAEASHTGQISSLTRQLSELQMAQSAHTKNMARKAEKDQKMRDVVATSPMSTNCALESCPIELDLGEENVECLVCEWLAGKDMEVGGRAGRKRAYYCSVEHAEEDFPDHDKKYHACGAGPECVQNGAWPSYVSRNQKSYKTDGIIICKQCIDALKADKAPNISLNDATFCCDTCFKSSRQHLKDSKYPPHSDELLTGSKDDSGMTIPWEQFDLGGEGEVFRSGQFSPISKR